MRLWSWLVVVLAVLVSAGAASGTDPARSTGVLVWGQPARSLEVAGRPLGSTIALFRAGPTAHLPASGLMRPLSIVAAHLRGDPGALVLAKTRRVTIPPGPVYLVPTTHGWVCVQGARFETCHRGLLRQGVTWTFYSTTDGLDVIGIAANDVRAVDLSWTGNTRRAELAHNVFFVHRPISITSAKHLPPFGSLTVAYRGGRASASVRLR
jgi:hypothetical protein